MKHHSIQTLLVVLAIVTTVLFTALFFVGIIETVPRLTGLQVVVIVIAIVILPFLPTLLILLCLFAVNKLHGYIIKWEDREDALRQRKTDREHFYQYRRNLREIEQEQYNQQSRRHQYRIKRCARHRRYLKRRRKDD